MVAILIVVCGVTFLLLRSWSRALTVVLFAVYMFMVVVITILSRKPHLDIYTVKLRSFETFTGSYNSNIFFAFSVGLLCSFGIEYTQYYTDRGSFEVDEGVYEKGSEYFLLQEGGKEVQQG
jgi:glycopeptide antibiotics resistance protein